MSPSMLAFALGIGLAGAAEKPVDRAREAVTQAVVRIQRADYEGDRAALAGLYAELAPYTNDEALASRVRYWRGFALWRRALNGFNDAVAPTELEADLGGAVAEFEAALAVEPGFLDASLGQTSCLWSLAYLVREDPARSQAYISRAVALFKDAQAAAPENPRMLWLLGGSFWYRPPERGGSQVEALAAYERGLQAARAQAGKVSDPLEPTWGEAELLMSLAWANLNRSTPDLDAAERHAQSALALVPYWHYVRDILLPQIRAARKPGTPIAS